MTALPKLRWMALPIAVGLGVIHSSPEPAAVPDLNGGVWGADIVSTASIIFDLEVGICTPQVKMGVQYHLFLESLY